MGGAEEEETTQRATTATVSRCRARARLPRAGEAGDARRRRRAMLGLTAPWTSDVRAEARLTPLPKSARELSRGKVTRRGVVEK